MKRLESGPDWFRWLIANRLRQRRDFRSAASPQAISLPPAPMKNQSSVANPKPAGQQNLTAPPPDREAPGGPDPKTSA